MGLTHLMIITALAAGGAAPLDAPATPGRYAAATAVSVATAKSVRVDCPAGTVVFGSGGRVVDGFGGVVLTGIMPDPALRSVTAYAVARPGHKGPWGLVAYAVCLPESGLAPVRVAAIGAGYTVTASCPTATVLYGNGFLLPNADAATYADEVVPDAGLTGVTVHTAGTPPGIGGLVVYGVCAGRMDRYERTHGVSGAGPGSPKEAYAPLPDYILFDHGRWTFGAGGLVEGSATAFLDGLDPATDVAGAWASASRLETTVVGLTGDDYTVTTYAATIGSWY
ncbi:hypothetical protein [Hamadaea tsunoensis]|uniref:hypothetical protein n=1 Tax=Hamadaea tsunoensis TaxID=53368 RepID=UPI0004803307|nr:hypothetical protein [Hamadaea tsunoensis]